MARGVVGEDAGVLLEKKGKQGKEGRESSRGGEREDFVFLFFPFGVEVFV